MMTSLRKSLSETSAPSPEPKFQTLLAHCSNSLSWVTPRSSVIASYSVRPGDLRLLLGSPPSRCLTTSVVRLSAPTLLIPATYLPSHLTRNLKFLYGSKRCAFTLNCAMVASLRLNLASHLLELDDHELGRLERREADDDVHDTQVDIVLRRRLLIALDEVRLGRRLALEGALAEQVVHERADVQADLRPQRFVVRLEHHPLQAAIQALFEVQRQAAHRHILVVVGQLVGAAQGARTPYDSPGHRERAQAVDAERVQYAVLRVVQVDLQALDAVEGRVEAGGRLPHAAIDVGARHHAGHQATRDKGIDLAVAHGVGLLDAREIQRGVARFDASQAQIS